MKAITPQPNTSVPGTYYTGGFFTLHVLADGTKYFTNNKGERVNG